jgi:large subunit ribosomal protein L9
MKVILTTEVKGKGGEGDVVDVARGYAVNYLFPRGYAVEASPGNVKQLEARVHNIRRREESRISDAQAIADSLEGKSVNISAKVGEEGRLFGSVTSQMIEDAIDEQLDVAVDRRKIDVHGHIKEIGEHEITVQVYRDIRASVTVNVAAEGVAHTVEEQIAEIEAETADAEAAEAEAVLEAFESDLEEAEAGADGFDEAPEDDSGAEEAVAADDSEETEQATE